MKKLQQHLALCSQQRLRKLIVGVCFSCSFFYGAAQCPYNIDFESGTFNGWQCYTGTFSSGNLLLAPSPPTIDRHTMLSSIPGNGLDPYGGFPKNCPNGSGHSLQLGNNFNGGQAERISYTFTIPANNNKFTLMYNYAIVLQDFNHVSHLQPRLRIDVTNVTDDILDGCSTVQFIVDSIIPGFIVSPNSPPGAPVRYKDWAAMSVNLSGNAGKTFRIDFTTTDCGATDHFGYAYIDINSQCSGSFIGAAFCADDTAINVTAPFGFQNYTWWDNNFTQILGISQTLHFNPPPTAGTIVKVELIPYDGYGCKDTLTAYLLDTLTIQPYAGPDIAICSNTPIQLGKPPELGLVYSWAPTTGLSNPNISNPIATAASPITYVLTVTHDGGGCASTDTVNISMANLDTSLLVIGSTARCSTGTGSTILKVMPADSIQWYRDNIAIAGANQTTYTVTQTGSYHAVLFGIGGCSVRTRTQLVNIYESPVPGFTVNNATQCYKNNQFVFTNTSTISLGALQYSWDLGDGNTDTATDITHTYLQPGTYLAKLLVKSIATNCTDTISMAITVYASPVAAFSVNNTDQCFKNHAFIFTNTSSPSTGNLQYTWHMGDGTLLTSKDVNYNYTLPGSYTVKMLINNTDGGCRDSSTININVYPSPVAGFTFNTPNHQCLLNNQFVFTNTTTITSGSVHYQWYFGDGLTDTVANPIHTYTQAGVYPVKMIAFANGGCVDSALHTVTLFPVAYAGFAVSPVCINLRVPVINLTSNIAGTSVNYLWDFGNGYSSTDRTPVYRYTVPGTYTISLTVNTTQCPSSLSAKRIDVTIDAPLPGVNYPVINTVSNFAETLQARNIGTSALWIPATSLDNRASYKPVFRGLSDQLYAIQLRTPSGCITIDTQLVKVSKKIKIYVPTVFTPGNDGKNDLLRPLLMGFNRVNYFRIYNRWGKLLFEMKSDRPGWDGRVKGQFAELQTLVWMIEAVDIDGVVHKEQGTTILMR